MILSILGDSISTYDNFIPAGNASVYPFFDVDSPSKTWWGLLLEQTGLQLGCNDSYSGARITKSVPWFPEWSSFISSRRQNNIKGADLLIVLGGTNDFGTQYLLPTLDEFTEAYASLVNSIVTGNPNTKCCFCTPLQRTDIDLYTANHKGFSLADLQQSIRNVIATDSRAYLLDIGRHTITKDMSCLGDGLHPNAKGMSLLCKWILKDLEDLQIIPHPKN
ncbi:MAG: SGNH/GDSL hydrolase family protein [Spirochaetia bacterium]|jgi:hypothetical protein|nr:SGNH/GDSL hydrolase family protein [Spirochaetia bacterium]